MKRRALPLVDRLRVRTPCDVGWENMDADAAGRDRHCARCDLTVHDVASMTRAEVEDLLEARERGERVCLHLHVRRLDGAVLVKDGHVTRGHVVRPPPSRVIAAAAATMTAMTAACASTTTPPDAPLAVIAVGSATATTPAPVVEPSPPPIETAPPIASSPPPETAPPVRVPVRPAKKIATPAPKPVNLTKPPSTQHYDLIDGDAW